MLLSLAVASYSGNTRDQQESLKSRFDSSTESDPLGQGYTSKGANRRVTDNQNADGVLAESRNKDYVPRMASPPNEQTVDSTKSVDNTQNQRKNWDQAVLPNLRKNEIESDEATRYESNPIRPLERNVVGQKKDFDPVRGYLPTKNTARTQEYIRQANPLNSISQSEYGVEKHNEVGGSAGIDNIWNKAGMKLAQPVDDYVIGKPVSDDEDGDNYKAQASKFVRSESEQPKKNSGAFVERNLPYGDEGTSASSNDKSGFVSDESSRNSFKMHSLSQQNWDRVNSADTVEPSSEFSKGAEPNQRNYWSTENTAREGQDNTRDWGAGNEPLSDDNASAQSWKSGRPRQDPPRTETGEFAQGNSRPKFNSHDLANSGKRYNAANIKSVTPEFASKTDFSVGGVGSESRQVLAITCFCSAINK